MIRRFNANPPACRRRSCAAAWCACALIALTLGCEESKTDPPPRPSLSDLRPSGADPDPTFNEDLPLARHVYAQKLVFEQSAGQVDVALSALDAPEQIPERTLDHWHTNHLYIAELKREDLDLFKANLPRMTTLSNQVIYPSPHYGSIDLVDHNTPQRVVAFSRKTAYTTRDLPRGSFRLLTRLTKPTDEQTEQHIDLLPHHHAPNPLLLPDDPDNLAQFGIAFDHLRVDCPIPPDTAWLIWCDLPAPPPPVAEPEEEPEDAKQETQPTPAAPVPLGRAMLTGNLQQVPVRLVVVITTRQAEVSRHD